MEKFEDPLLKKESQGIFKLYLDRKEVGAEMLRSFLDLELNKNNAGFILKEDFPHVGIISQCYGIITIAEYLQFILKSDIDVDETESSAVSKITLESYEDLTVKYPEIWSKLNIAFNDILERIGVNSEDNYCFGATPYLSDDKEISSYTETVALVLRVAIEMRNLLCLDYEFGKNNICVDKKFIKDPNYVPHDADDEGMMTLKEIGMVEDLLIKCIDVINNSALTINGGKGRNYFLKGTYEPLYDVDGGNMKYKGWTFTEIPKDKHDKCDPSLYFTYIISDAYLAFYENYGTAIELVRMLRAKIKEYRADPSKTVPEGETVVSADPEAYGLSLAKYDASTIRDFNFIKRLYFSYRLFNKTVLDAGHFVDIQFAKIDTTRDFFSYNFALVTAQDVESSSSNDALFNVLFAINILMAAGVDLDYKAANKEVEFYDSLQYAVPNIQRLYKKLLRLGKESVCDRYTLKYNEALPNDDADNVDSAFNKVKLLRRRNIHACNLMPIIVKTYNILSKFLTPYPQYEMRIYKDNIMLNKMDGCWLWDKDGFLLINNYNYVYALRNFYDYYEKYERPYALSKTKYISEKNEYIANLRESNNRELQEKEKKSKAALAKEKETHSREIENLRKLHEHELETLNARIDELSKKRAPVENEIESIIDRALGDMLKKQLNSIIQSNGHSVYETEDLLTVFKRAFLSFFTKQCEEVVSEIGEVAEDKQEAFKSIYKDIDHYSEHIVFENLGEVITERIHILNGGNTNK